MLPGVCPPAGQSVTAFCQYGHHVHCFVRTVISGDSTNAFAAAAAVHFLCQSTLGAWLVTNVQILDREAPMVTVCGRRVL